MDNYRKLRKKLDSTQEQITERLELEQGLLEWHEDKLTTCTEEINNLNEQLIEKRNELEIYNSFDFKKIMKNLMKFFVIDGVIVSIAFFSHITSGELFWPIINFLALTSFSVTMQLKDDESIKVRRRYTDNYLKAIIENIEEKLSDEQNREYFLKNAIAIYRENIKKLGANQETLNEVESIVETRRAELLEALATDNEELLNKMFINDKNEGVFRLERVKRDNE